MRCPAKPSNAKRSAASESALAKPLAPEDVRSGDFVAVLHVVCEVPSYYWSDESFRLPHDELVRLQYIPDDAGAPLKVKSVCLPFVSVKNATGELKTLDLRRCRIARLDREYAKKARKASRNAHRMNGREPAAQAKDQ
jgi:hypothetical protein